MLAPNANELRTIATTVPASRRAEGEVAPVASDGGDGGSTVFCGTMSPQSYREPSSAAARRMALRTRAYVPQRQTFVIARSISASVGCGISLRSAAADMIMPDWQYPHCGTCSAIQARCSRCRPFFAKPSIVVIDFPFATATGSEQERTAPPSRCTVHAPQAATPQPNFVPVNPS